VEAYAKRGRSRRLVHGHQGQAASFHSERGWAVRASTARASLFAAGSGEIDPGGPWPEPDGRPIRLPDPGAAGRAAPWSEPPDLETPLIGETEGLRQLAALGAELARELPGARLLSAVLEDGSSESRLASSRGVAAAARRRVAVLHVEAAYAAHRGAPQVAVAVDLAEREARRFGPRSVARRLADRLVAAAAEPPADLGSRDRGEMLLAPPLAARLLAALTPWLVGPRAPERLGALRDRRGRVGSDSVTLADDGRLAGGALEAPVDGEGLPTSEVTLVERGTFRQPLLSWHDLRGAEGGGLRATGCSRRASWRDVPRPGPTHLYLAPQRDLSAADLLADLARGYYLLDATGPVRLNVDADTFTVPVCGFQVQAGRALAPVAGVRLSGGVGALLRGVQAAARDLAFFPLDGMIGSPTLLVTGLELLRR
jgi:predicted Zn-dependent protease